MCGLKKEGRERITKGPVVFIQSLGRIVSLGEKGCHAPRSMAMIHGALIARWAADCFFSLFPLRTFAHGCPSEASPLGGPDSIPLGLGSPGAALGWLVC